MDPHGAATYDRGHFDLRSVVAQKGDTSIAVCLPAKDEEATVGEISAAISEHLMRPRFGAEPLVDDLVVLDDGSTDTTAAVAAASGARVVRVTDVLPDSPPGSGKGNVLWKSVAATTSDLIVWCDADLERFDPSFVTSLVGPLLADPTLVLSKGFYERPLPDDPTGGGRTTELVARPLLSLMFAELTSIRQPLGGEYAARRTAVERVPFVQGYGVEIGLLIDLAQRFGIEAVAQVDLGVRHHRNRSLHELSAQSMEIMVTALARAGVGPRPDWSHVLIRPEHEPLEVDVRERPPLVEVEAYAQRSEAAHAA